jgi:hypothetical protein
MPKDKISFTLDGVKYTDIAAYTYGGDRRDSYNVGVSGTAQMVRQWMKQKYPSIPTRNYYWVQSDSYAGGDSIRVYLNDAPKEFYEKLNKELNDKFEEGKFDGMTDSYSYNKSAEKSAEGMVIDYGTKYLFVNNYKPSDSDAPSVDWESVLSQKSAPSAPARTSPSGQRPSYPVGEVLKDCAGWTIYKKTLPDGRIVYNAKIKPDTPKNKGDWNEIKGEIYVQTGFKWGRFGAFEKWGVIASEAAVVEILCKILGKYYQGGDAPASVPAETPAPAPAPQPEAEKKIGVYANGNFLYNVSSQEEGFDKLKESYGEDKVVNMIYNNQTNYNVSKSRIDVLKDNFIYGYKWGVPKNYGNELKFEFIDRGFKINSISKNGQLVIFKKDMVSDGLIINDNGGEFNIDKYGSNVSVGSVNYVIGEENYPVSTSTLAGLIENIYDNERDGKSNQEAPAATGTKSKEDIAKAIKGLQYLADKGNEKAIKAIKGLQYLLNK